MVRDREPTKVILVTENSLIGEGLAVSLSDASSVDLVGRTSDPVEMVRLVEEVSPDVIIVTLRATAGLTTSMTVAVHRVRSRFPEMGTVIISDMVDSFVLDLLMAETSRIAYLLDDEVRSMATVLHAVHQVCAGRSVLDPGISDALAQWHEDMNFDHLEDVEIEILDLMTRGLSDSSIADVLQLPVESVTDRVASLFDKLGLFEHEAFDRRMSAVLIRLRARTNPAGPNLFGDMSAEVRDHLRSLLDQRAMSVAAGGEWVQSEGPAGRPTQTPPIPETEIALLDAEGVIVSVNAAWVSFCTENGGDPGRAGVGSSYLDACTGCDDPHAKEVERALRVALRGDLPAPLRLLIPCNSPESERWFDVLISSRIDQDGHCLGAAVTLSHVV